jgi:phosphoenolpyruvate carboxylase
MKEILDQMEEHIAAIRNLQRNFDFHSKKLERLMISLNKWHLENTSDYNDRLLQLERDD